MGMCMWMNGDVYVDELDIQEYRNVYKGFRHMKWHLSTSRSWLVTKSGKYKHPPAL